MDLRRLAALPLLLPFVPAATAATPSDARACAAIASDPERLACYDSLFPRRVAPASAAARPTEPPVIYAFDEPASPRAEERSLLDSRWELEPDAKLGAFNIRGYKPLYVLPFFHTSNINASPRSPSPDHDVELPERLKAAEMKFQLSFKGKILESLFGDNGDLWLGYTQASHWQVANPQISRPFRETNYEPELMLVFRSDLRVLGWDGHLFGVSVNHQSNGRSLPLSRSWNRVVGQAGFERGDWTVMVRPWWIFKESFDKSDNPDIGDYLGHGDVQIVRVWNGHEFALMLRPSAEGGAAQFDWAFPIHNQLRGHLQLFDGYGESLIDYNHRATYVGLGLSLLEWY
ncbi:phospholipase A [Tahibacter caeni]|uniref:phospholipase A n=1 Tax=Tahibacter caeni TaxID=1453545 RepID=UPI0021487A10|nr:phospholipase A [Tahibacter caeni]